VGKPTRRNQEEAQGNMAKQRQESHRSINMAVTLTDEQIKALQAGKATIEDFTQPKEASSSQFRNLKEDTIVIKQVLAKIGETQLTLLMSQSKPFQELKSLLKLTIVVIFAMSLIILGTIVMYANGFIKN
jgi:hypothetical protein